ncbi:MAG: tRNA pseudouridine(38-40) synthase TruA [Leptospiraceae bacterium]|nr:tRNA pseudouridine(38-40) synthase TruA [Leptospiraceae bacterium]
MPKTVLILQYDGPKFNGFQKQKSAKEITVQEKLESVISRILREDITLVAAGRTDAGVHANGMVVSFSSTNSIPNFHKFLVSVNGLAGGNVSALAGREVPDNFHARFSCSAREYEYKILNSKYPHPLLNQKVLWYKNKIDFTLLEKEIYTLQGKHDFASFTKKAVLETYSTTERQITKIEFKQDEEMKNLFKIVIQGTGFLHNMVRIIIGTLLDIARGRLKSNILSILESKDRTDAGVTLPPYALYFLRAYYKDFPEVDRLYSEIYQSAERA